MSESALARARSEWESACDAVGVARRRVIAEIRAERANGATLEEIGAELGLSRSRVLRLERDGE